MSSNWCTMASPICFFTESAAAVVKLIRKFWFCKNLFVVIFIDGFLFQILKKFNNQ